MAKRSTPAASAAEQPGENTAEVVVIDPKKVTDLVAKEYSVSDQRVAELVELYGSIEIAGPDDKENIKLAQVAVRELRTVRTSVEKKRLEFKRLFTGAIDGVAKKIQDALNPIETRLKTRLDEIEREEEIRKAAELKARVTRLCEAGFQYNGVAYVCGESRIFEVSIPNLTDEDIENHCAYAVAFRQAEFEAERLRKEEEARLKAENEAKDRELADLRAKLAAMEAAAAPKPEPDPTPVVSPVHQPFTPTHHGQPVGTRSGTTSADIQPIQSTENWMDGEWSPKPAPKPSVISGKLATAAAEAPRQEEPAPAPVPVDTMPIRETPGAPAPTAFDHLDQYSAAFDEGYNAFRQQVITLFQDESTRRTRAQWIETFENLTPETKV